MKLLVSVRVGQVVNEYMQESIFLYMFGRIRMRMDPSVSRGPICSQFRFCNEKFLPIKPEGNYLMSKQNILYLMFILKQSGNSLK